VESHARLARLTPREVEVFEWLIAGLINKQIAEEVGVTLRTIKQHRARVMQKTGAVSLVELVRLAMKAGVAPAQPRATCRSNMELAAVWHKQLSAAG
jgi:FixJ family two-component response regulator